MEKQSRLGIYRITDEEGIVDDYCIYFLNELKKNVSQIIIIYSGDLWTDEYAQLQSYSDYVLIDNNERPVFEIYMDIFEHFVGWDNILGYDEMILADDSFYGPFCPLSELFEKMSTVKSDFWGITKAYENSSYYLEMYFTVIRKTMIRSKNFRVFWEGFNTNHESFFTKYFLRQGFRLSSLVSDDDSDSAKFYINIPKMIAGNACPILKKDSITRPFTEVLDVSLGEIIPEAIRYIDQKTEYDAGLIFKNLIRILDPGELNHILKLRYVLPYESLNIADTPIQTGTAALIAHMNYPDLIEECFTYLKQIPVEIDIYVTTKTERNKRVIEDHLKKLGRLNFKVIIIGDRGREIRGMLVECAEVFKKYEFVGFVHDKKSIRGVDVPQIGMSYMYMIWDNTLKSPEYIRNVISLLKQNSFLGVLSPPAPYHWNFFGHLGNEWTTCFDETVKLSEMLHLQCKMSKKWPPFALTTTFWCKSRALIPLITYGFSGDDFPEEPMPLDGTINHAIERIFAYVAQSQGYAVGIMMNAQFASLQLSNYHSIIHEILYLEQSMIPVRSFRDFVENDMQKLKDFSDRYDRIYILGIDHFAEQITKFMRIHNMNLDGYVIQDGEEIEQVHWEKKLYLCSQLSSPPDRTGIIANVDIDNRSKILSSIKAEGYINICQI